MANARGVNVVLYFPNLIDYGRVGLFGVSWWFYATENWETFIDVYVVAVVLDWIDGYFARKLNQVSLFGAWLDVAVDNFQRGFLWTHLFPGFGSLISSIEWLTFLCTHSRGKTWKEKSSQLDQPYFIAKITENGFGTPLGEAVVASVHFLPICVFLVKHNLALWAGLIWPIIAVLIIFRLCSFSVEVWLIYVHVRMMLLDDSKAVGLVRKSSRMSLE